MDTHLTENTDEPLSETPEDVAILYSWANLHGAKYRDFSASRREYRAQVRHRAAEELRRAELSAKADAEAAAAEADRIARESERAARTADQHDSSVERERALRNAEEAARRAAAERVEAARRAEAAAVAEAVARREEREIAEAHASAQRQAKSYSSSEIRRRYLAGPQPSRIQPGLSHDPYEHVHSNDPIVEHHIAPPQMPRRSDLPSQILYRDEYPGRAPEGRASSQRQSYRPENEVRRRPQGFRPDETSGFHQTFRPGAADLPPAPSRNRIASQEADFGRKTPLRDDRRSPPRPISPATPPDQPGPAWLYASTPAQYAPQPPAPASTPLPPPPAASPVAGSSVEDTLEYSRERVASRWFALKGAFDPSAEPQPEIAAVPQKETPTPVLAVFSLAGGVGKTSLVATLGRALSSLGEKVLLADTTSHGLLPFYFGASELRAGVVRTFSPPSGSKDAPIHLVSYEVDKTSGDAVGQDVVLDELAQSANGTQRIVLDMNAASGWMIRRLSRISPTVLVPVSPDMNSVISLQSVERYFEGIVDRDNRPVLPHYVLNQFDASLPLHLDVREVLRRQLGDRLLPFVIRRAPAVSEALAEGMTVIDYAPDASVAEDYLNIASWLRKLSAPATQGFRNIRWSER